MSSDKLRLNIGYFLAMSPFLWVAVVVVYTCYFAFPQTDDFCTYGRLIFKNNINPFLETWNLYKSWTGRYSSSFVISASGWLTAVSPTMPYWMYFLSIFLGLLFVFVAVSKMLLRTMSAANDDPLYTVFPAALIIVVIAVVLMPSKLEGIYWFTGAAVYTLGVGVFLILAARLQEVSNESAPVARMTLEIAALVVFCVGFNELLALSLGGFVFVRFLVFPLKSYFRQHVLLSSVFLFAMLLTVLAPGNFARDSVINSERHNVMLALLMAKNSMNVFFTGHVLSHKLQLTSLFIGAFVSGVLIGRFRGIYAANWRAILPIIVALLLALPIHAPVYSFLTGEESPGRVINQAYLMLLMGLGGLMYWLGLVFSNKFKGWQIGKFEFLVLGISGVWILCSPQFEEWTKLLREFAPEWRSAQLRRIDLLADARRTQSAADLPALPAYSARWPLLQGGDITEDKAYWVNGCLAGYYGLNSVALKPLVLK